MWPKLENDYMEIGESGWISIGEGCFINKHTGHTIDEVGREFDQNGVILFDPEKDIEESDLE